MAVLIEGLSVVVRMEAIGAKYLGGWDAFKGSFPNKTLCCDNEIARVGFMSPEDVEGFVDGLEAKGLIWYDGAVDVVVVDQLEGVLNPCAWAEYGHVVESGHKVAACRLKGSTQAQLWKPEGWIYEESLSSPAQCRFIATEEVNKQLTHLRTEGSLDVYRDTETDVVLHIGRTRS